MSTQNFDIQIRKGLLEFCVIQIVFRGEVYTSDILEELKKSKIIVVEGTLYPLLNRLKTLGFVKYNWKESKDSWLTDNSQLFLKLQYLFKIN